MSETGNLIFLPRNTSVSNLICVVDRLGNIIDKDSIPLTIIEKVGKKLNSLDISPNGEILAFTGRSFGIHDIWLLNLASGAPERITFDPAEEEAPVWSPDGNKVAYTTAGAIYRLFIQNLDSAGNPHLVRSWPHHIHFTSWSPDGKWLAAYDNTSTNGTDCYTISVKSGESIPVATSQANETNGQFSPDGRWLAFESDESGRSEIYVITFPKLENKKQISIDGGSRPRWDRSGKFIYYISNGFMIAQPVELSKEFKRGNPIKLFMAHAMDFDLSPDGQRFYLVRKNLKRPNEPLHLITNWFQELENKKSN